MTDNEKHIPAGYKSSPLGIVPEDWEVKRLGEIGEVLMCKRIMKYQTEPCGDIPFFKIGTFGGKPDAYISKEIFDEYKTKYSYPKVGDVLISAAGTIGRSVIFDGTPSYYQDSNIVWIDNNNKQLLNKYLYYYYSTINWITDTGTIPRLYNGALKAIQIPLPPIEQQKQIVSILELWDTAISKQTQLIEKLTLRKRGLMQQLLTGKKRLKGFSGEWKYIKLGNIAERITRKNEEDNKNVVTISAQRGFVVQTDFFNKSVASEVLDNYYLVHKDEFCYNKSYSNGYPMGAIKRLKTFDKAVVTTLYICFKLKEKPKTNIDFFEQYSESGLLNKELVKVANEGGRAHGLLNVTPDDFFNMHMNVPTIEEQNAIASVLVDVDNEIELANKKLARLQEEKKGLMQVLLTGKKRVK